MMTIGTETTTVFVTLSARHLYAYAQQNSDSGVDAHRNQRSCERSATAGAQHQPWDRSERQPHPARVEDRTRLELRRGQSREVYVARSARHVGRQAGAERRRMAAPAAARDH